MIIISDLSGRFIDRDSLIRVLGGTSLGPVGEPVSRVGASQVRGRLLGGRVVTHIRTCGAPSNVVGLRIRRGVPVLHIVDPENGCCISGLKDAVPIDHHCITRIPIIDKCIRGRLTMASLCGFTLFLRRGSF